MNAIVMDMNGYDIEHEVLVTEEYGEEVMCAGWNPLISLVSESPVAQINKHVNLPAHLVNRNVDAFLKRMYRYQC